MWLAAYCRARHKLRRLKDIHTDTKKICIVIQAGIYTYALTCMHISCLSSNYQSPSLPPYLPTVRSCLALHWVNSMYQVTETQTIGYFCTYSVVFFLFHPIALFQQALSMTCTVYIYVLNNMNTFIVHVHTNSVNSALFKTTIYICILYLTILSTRTVAGDSFFK